MGLLSSMEDLEREDGEAVDHHAGSFGVERGGCILIACEFKQEEIDALDQIVALLVDSVDSVLLLRRSLRQRHWDRGRHPPDARDRSSRTVLSEDERASKRVRGKLGLGCSVPSHVRGVVELLVQG